MSKSGVSEGEIIEGLLCPHCLSDFKTIDQLQDHFELNHSTEDVIQRFKGLFDKAKRKILKQESAVSELNKSPFDPEYTGSIRSDIIDLSNSKQDIGAINNHIESFKKIRVKRINHYGVETNILLIRLERLTCNISTDPETRKEFEQSVVPWVEDNDVPLCPGCGKSFRLARRRHHCRLCGCVICNSCSFFITFEFARKITLPAVLDDQLLLQKRPSHSRKSSSSSLMSIMAVGNEHGQAIRTCKECHKLIQRHDRLLQQKNHRPVILQIYEKLKESMNDIDTLLPNYIEMIESLNLGETNYQLQDIQSAKVKISKLAEKIDAYSKRILKIESSEEENNSRNMQLQNAIHSAASQFLRENVLGLPTPPTQDEILRQQTKRLHQVHKRIQMEKEAELKQNMKENSKSPSPVKVQSIPIRQEPISSNNGWCVSSIEVKEESDPLMQQIEVIRTTIKKAKIDKKFDDVEMLEKHLEELKAELAARNPFLSEI